MFSIYCEHRRKSPAQPKLDKWKYFMASTIFNENYSNSHHTHKKYLLCLTHFYHSHPPLNSSSECLLLLLSWRITRAYLSCMCVCLCVLDFVFWLFWVFATFIGITRTKEMAYISSQPPERLSLSVNIDFRLYADGINGIANT